MPRATLAICLLLAIHAGAHADDAAATFKARVLPVLTARCAECHSGKEAEAKLDLTQARTLEQLRGEVGRWFRVLERVEEGSMPPADAEPLSAAQRQAVAGWVRQDLAAHLQAVQQQEGRSKLRRLTRAEYANTLLDLFGIRPPVVRELPSDGRVDGFEKVSAALPLSSANAAGYIKITEDMLGRMLQGAAQPDRNYRLWAGPSEQSAGHILELPDGTMVSFNTDTTSGPLRTKTPDGKFGGGMGARVPGMHHLRMSVYAYQTDKPLAFGIYAGHIWAYPQLIELVKVLEAPPGKPTVLETDIYLRTSIDNDVAPVSDGFRLVPFGLGVPVPKNTQASDCKGPGLAVQWVDVEEPALPLAGDRWLTADLRPEFLTALVQNATLESSKLPRDEVLAVLTQSLRRIGARLFRRELTDVETAQARDHCAAQLAVNVPLKTALLEEVAALMTAPDFLCVVEQPGALTDFALASRLAYFLWNSTPDDELLEVARQGKLHDDAMLRQQTERLLGDVRSQRFVKDFLDQWLGLWGIDNTTPDKDLYPEYDDVLKISSVMETQASFRRLLDQNLSVRELVAPKRVLVNERLAAHYGIADVRGFALQELDAPADSPFGGVWTQAATMKVTANGTTTSPVKRGVWVAERLLGTPIPPPPPNIQPVNPDTRGAKTLREQLALHSSQGSCQACHAKFDPYGFALESFDVTGAFRKNYREADPDLAKLPAAERQGKARWRDGLPVDCSGQTPDGSAFAGIQTLRESLAKQPERLARGVTRHLVTYSTGTPVSQVDHRTIDAIVKAASAENYGLRSLVHGVVQSQLFRSK
jgi:mono/diheme cytochrome c family protein